MFPKVKSGAIQHNKTLYKPFKTSAKVIVKSPPQSTDTFLIKYAVMADSVQCSKQALTGNYLSDESHLVHE